MSEESKVVDETPPPPAGDDASSSKDKGKGKAAPSEDLAGAVPGVDMSQPVGKLDKKTMDQIIRMNPSLKAETQGKDPAAVQKMLETMKLGELLAGMATGKNAKDMASYKFWKTQPVPRFDDNPEGQTEGEIKQGDPDKVPKEPYPLLDGFEWCTMDLLNEDELIEVYKLLNGHYVEDEEAMFRFAYSSPFFKWALMPPGWKKDWHVGVRVKPTEENKKGKLVAFISAIPLTLRIRTNVVNCSEVNFLCIHKKLRGKRLAPVLIREVTRRCNIIGIWQALYTGGAVLPTPISSCRYYHRSLDWLKLNEVGFSPLPPNSSKAKQITRYALPAATKVDGLRPMEAKDTAAVKDLMDRYLVRFDMAPQFTEEEIDHWFLSKDVADAERVIWTYVVEDPKTQKITDFFNFYCLESSVINNSKHPVIKAAYLFYYATETAFGTYKDNNAMKAKLKARLNELMNDALIIAKGLNFDVFNALTLLDNVLFLVDQKFGAGDGQLHYYLYNWRTAPIRGGMNNKMGVDDVFGSGIGMVML
ncbi:glycylpeptide N-tetradecanoyltransferase [Orbilia ellipsospora]|uniref:Glycylpeptide N-tetradecanoyltransferase n=1 Tax=Orbilia ellipsospora TaxID=2528407 RepID=A0AAV9X3D4_9PEZI